MNSENAVASHPPFRVSVLARGAAISKNFGA